MKKFYWKGLDRFGQNKKGYCFAESKEQLSNLLRDKGVALLSCREEKNRTFSFSNNLTLEQKYFFFSQLAVLIESGVELLVALKVLLRQAKTKKLKNIILQIIESIKSGDSFSIALKKQTPIFEPFIIHMIMAGENSGKLGAVLNNLSDYLNDKILLKNKLKKAALMPLITLVFAVVIILGIFIFVVPQFETLFNSFEKKIPESTQLVLRISHFLRTEKAFYFFIAILFFLLFIKFLFLNKTVKKIRDIILLNFKIFLLQDLISFLQTNYIFLESGINLDKSLQYSSKTVKNSYFYQKTLMLKELVSKGKSLEEALTEIGPRFFPDNLVAVVSVGEHSGNLDLMLKKAAAFFTDELKKRLHFLTTIFQPLLLMFIGLLVAFLLLSIYLPIFEMAGLF